MNTDRGTFIESCLGATASGLGLLPAASSALVLPMPEAAASSQAGSAITHVSPMPPQSLSGIWRLRMGPQDAGIQGKWYQASQGFEDRIPLPGSTSQSNFGTVNEQWDRQHLTRTYVFTGPVWYQRDVQIPRSWDSGHTRASWAVHDSSGVPVASGSLTASQVPTGKVTALGAMHIKLARLKASAMYSIECRVGDAANDWNVWVYPRGNAARDRSGKVTVARNLREALPALQKGCSVVLFLGPGERAKTVPTSFTTIFWSAEWFPRRHETMGIFCDPSHSAFRFFPTAAHADWQWWELMSKSRAFDLTETPQSFQPIVSVIDDAARARRLGAVVEARVGAGRLLATSLDLDSGLAGRPAAAALRTSLIRYAASADFQPKGALTVDSLKSLLSPV